MKKIILSLGLLIFTNSLSASLFNSGAPFLHEYEYIDLSDLYRIYKNDSSSLKNYGTAFIHSRLVLVEKHIQVIEHTKRPENIWKRKYELAGCGLFIAGLFGFAGFITAKEFLQQYAEFTSKKFKAISIPYSWVETLRQGENLPDKQFSSKEKRNLKKFSFEKVESLNVWRVGNTTYTQTWTVDPLKLPHRIREKFNYLALDHAIPTKKRELFMQGLLSTGIVASAAGLGLYCLYQALYQEDILAEQLELAKEAHKFLESIEKSR